MPAVNVVRTSWGRNTDPGGMGIQVDGNPQVYSMYTTPPAGVYGAPVSDVQTTDRPGMKPLTSPKGQGLKTYSFEHRVFHPNPTGNIENELRALRNVASEGRKVHFYNVSSLATDTWYWVQECRITEEEKGAGNKARVATVAWTLVEATKVNPVDWTQTAFKEQPPIRIEANGPEQAETSHGTVKNDTESGDPAGTETGTVTPEKKKTADAPSAEDTRKTTSLGGR